MPLRDTAYRGKIEYRQYLKPDGTLHEPEDLESLDLSVLEEIYRWMVKARRFDEKALNLQRQGVLGTYAPFRGQEAAQIASERALEETDLLVPSYREQAACLSRGIPPHEILLYWAGDERGHRSFSDHAVYPVSIPVGSHPIHAVGAMRADQLQGNGRVGAAYFGDGATSEGDLLEAMNFAGLWGTPVLFLCQNNQWAISLPRNNQTASTTLAQKALAFGIEGRLVDGNDPIGVYLEVDRARRICHENEEPYFLELDTFRQGDHTTADDASRYRKREEEERWKERDPLPRTRRVLHDYAGWSENDEQALQQEVRAWLEEELDRFQSEPSPSPDDMFDHLYEAPPASLIRQRRRASGGEFS